MTVRLLISASDSSIQPPQKEIQPCHEIHSNLAWRSTLPATRLLWVHRVEYLWTPRSSVVHRDSAVLHKELHRKRDSGQTHPGLSKPKALDDLRWPDSPEETELNLQVRGQSSMQWGKGKAAERHQSCKKARKKGGRTPYQQQSLPGVAGTTEHHQLQRLNLRWYLTGRIIT